MRVTTGSREEQHGQGVDGVGVGAVDAAAGARARGALAGARAREAGAGQLRARARARAAARALRPAAPAGQCRATHTLSAVQHRPCPVLSDLAC